MQFNFVIGTNERHRTLAQIQGPNRRDKAFNQPKMGYVGALVMRRPL
jgi:hypothetical protein